MDLFKKTLRYGKAPTFVPFTIIREHWIGLNNVASKQCSNGNKYVVLFAVKNIPAVCFTFLNVKLLHSVSVGNARGYTQISADDLLFSNPWIIRQILKLDTSYFQVHLMPEKLIPEDYKGSECYYAPLTTENSIQL